MDANGCHHGEWGALAGTVKVLNTQAPTRFLEHTSGYTSIAATLDQYWADVNLDTCNGNYWPLQLPEDDISSAVMGPCIRQIRLGQNGTGESFVGAVGWTAFKFEAWAADPTQQCVIYMI